MFLQVLWVYYINGSYQQLIPFISFLCLWWTDGASLMCTACNRTWQPKEKKNIDLSVNTKWQQSVSFVCFWQSGVISYSWKSSSAFWKCAFKKAAVVTSGVMCYTITSEKFWVGKQTIACQEVFIACTSFQNHNLTFMFSFFFSFFFLSGFKQGRYNTVILEWY